MLLEYKQRASAGRSGCGENARPTLVQGQFIPAWSQQAMIYPEVPMDERASAWLVTETYQSGKHQPAVTNDPHYAQSEDARLQQQSDDGGLSRLRSVHVQPEESEARCQVGVAVGRSRPREIAEAVRHPDVHGPPGVRWRDCCGRRVANGRGCPYLAEGHLARLPAGTAVIETRACDRNAGADRPRPRRNRANHRRRINECVGAGYRRQIAEAVRHPDVHGPPGQRWRDCCGRRVANGRVRCRYPAEGHLARLPAGTAVIETRACDRNAGTDRPRPRRNRANHRRRINECVGAGYRRQIAEAVRHPDVHGPPGQRWRDCCGRRVANGRGCPYPAEGHLARLPAGTAVIETRACDRNEGADRPEPGETEPTTG